MKKPIFDSAGASANFKIAVYRADAGKHWFEVLVFNTKKAMHGWYERNRPELGYENEVGDFAGMVLPYEWLRVKSDGSSVRFPEIGTVLLWKNRLGSGLIAHEMLHCALWYDRLINGNKIAEYGESIGDSEERLAYLLTDLTRACVKGLNKHVWE